MVLDRRNVDREYRLRFVADDRSILDLERPIDKLQRRDIVWNKFEEVFTVLYAMVYLVESGKANGAKALNGRKGIGGPDEICRNRSEIGLNVARRDFVALQRVRNSLVDATTVRR